MNVASAITLALKVSVMLVVFSLGLGVSAADVLYLRRRPGLLTRSLISIDVIMPLVAGAVAIIFHLRPAVEISLLALAISPVPPLLPRKGLKAGGHAPYIFSLLVAAAVLAIVLTPNPRLNTTSMTLSFSLGLGVNTIGNGTLAAITGFIVVGLAIGHVFGGPEPNNKTTLALFTAARHPGIA